MIDTSALNSVLPPPVYRTRKHRCRFDARFSPASTRAPPSLSPPRAVGAFYISHSFRKTSTINMTGVLLSVAQVPGLVQILLQTDAAGVLSAELPSVLVVGNEHGRGHGHGNVNTYTHDDAERRRRRGNDKRRRS